MCQHYFKETMESSSNDVANTSVFISENEVLIAGSTQLAPGPQNGLLIKLDTIGSVVWSRSIGGTGTDILYKVISLSSGGYLVVGSTSSYGAGNDDYWVIKFDALDNMEWSRTFGGVADDRAYTAMETSDGGLLIGGWTRSFGAGLLDVYIVKLDFDGNLIWSKTYGQNGNDFTNFARFTENDLGNYLISGGWTNGLGISGHNGFLMELNTSGDVISSNIYGGGANDNFNGYLNFNGGLIHAIDDSWSWGGQLRVWMNEIDATGNLAWSKTFGIANRDLQYSTAIHVGNEYIISAHENASTPTQLPLLMKVNSSGDLIWSKAFTENENDKILSLASNANGAIMAFGYTEERGVQDILIIKTNLEGDGNCVQDVNILESVVTPSVDNPNAISSDLSLIQPATPQINTINLSENIVCTTELNADFQLGSSMCINECLNMTDGSTGDIDSWQWVFTGANVDGSTQQNPSNICFVEPGMQSITLTISNAFESASITKQIFVNPNPFVEINSPAATTVCEGSSLVLSINTQNVDHIQWSTGSNANAITVESGGNYSVTVTNGCGSMTDQITIGSLLRPSIDLGNDKTACAGEVIVLGNEDPDITAYTWNDGSVNSTLEVRESGTYWVDVENSCGVVREAIEITFLAFGDLEVPNVFTPNGDGLNEYFIVDSRLLGSALKVFQRTGTKVYESINYQNDWDGGDLPPGIYFWHITNECGDNYKGSVTIIR